MTGYNTFITPIHGKILEIEDMDTGKKIVFGHEQKIQIKRNGTPMEILGKDFKETDEFVSY